MRQRTQNPPPLKACRFDSDLGHHLDSVDLLSADAGEAQGSTRCQHSLAQNKVD
jgi:hypothetical protein